ncbi:hypothetical protein BC940DRAFT_163113 [Gongronella butleri]|nr:hypothetical protein BC940DRAFT_163113 [Gongronella butleri]
MSALSSAMYNRCDPSLSTAYPPCTPPPYMNHPLTTHEEIATIFVVGFPDDMREREFQNMFIFSPGFEAATLKIPKDEEDETSSKKQIVSKERQKKKKKERGKIATHIFAHTHTILPSLPPFCPPPPLSPLTISHDQKIGFAKFRTRVEAIKAKDIINGRKIDIEKGSVLKAEMAKKNLHNNSSNSNKQRHGSMQLDVYASNGAPTGAPNQGGWAPSAFFTSMPPQTHADRPSVLMKRATSPTHAASVYEAFHSVPACHAPPPPPALTHASTMLASPPLLPTHQAFEPPNLFEAAAAAAAARDEPMAAMPPLVSPTHTHTRSLTGAYNGIPAAHDRPTYLTRALSLKSIDNDHLYRYTPPS